MASYTDPRRTLDRFARRKLGYSDFDTFIRTGGSVADAITLLRAERVETNRALAALQTYRLVDRLDDEHLDDIVALDRLTATRGAEHEIDVPVYDKTTGQPLTAPAAQGDEP
jgi:hypothetical protein